MASRRAAGLWKWNWADSHRSVSSILSSSFVVDDDGAGSLLPLFTHFIKQIPTADPEVNPSTDINRDVGPIVPHKGSAQGGYLYAYNLLTELDVAGEYFIEKKSAKLSFMPPTAATQAQAGGAYSVSRLTSAVVASGVSNLSMGWRSATCAAWVWS